MTKTKDKIWAMTRVTEGSRMYFPGRSAALITLDPTDLKDGLGH